MPTLFETSENLQMLFATIDEQGGELTPEQEAELAITQDNLNEKLDGYRHTIMGIEAVRDRMKLEQKRIADYLKAQEAKIERLESAMLTALMTFGKPNKTGVYVLEVDAQVPFKLSSRKSESVVVLDEHELPAQAWRIPPTPEAQVDKVWIKSAIKDGQEVPGAELATKYSLTIK